MYVFHFEFLPNSLHFLGLENFLNLRSLSGFHVLERIWPQSEKGTVSRQKTLEWTLPLTEVAQTIQKDLA